MYCGQCGNELVGDSKFCPSCGTKANAQKKEEGPIAADKIIENSEKNLIFWFLFPLTFLSWLVSIGNEFVDSDYWFDFAVAIIGAIIELLVIQFVIFNRIAKAGSTQWLTGLTLLHIISVLIQVAATFLGLDFPDSEALKLTSGNDFSHLFFSIIQIGVFLYLRQKFIKKLSA